METAIIGVAEKKEREKKGIKMIPDRVPLIRTDTVGVSTYI